MAASENGWEPARATADQCEWITVPGTNPPVRLQIFKGRPLLIMRAYAADYNAYIEPLRDDDSASWTPTNSVATSNHLNGTAMDLNWELHPFRVDYAGFDGPKIARMRDLLAFYNFEGIQIMFWAQDWNNPKDAMHHQCGYGTFQRPDVLDRFINQRIRADGFSTYKRGAPPPSTTYGLPTGTSINYGAPGFPDWVYQLAGRFNVRASTYPGHQESDRVEAGYARNPAHLNRGIDWAGPVVDMQRFADYLASIPQALEQVIWQNPNTGRSIEVAGGRHQPGYFAADLAGHRDHVHTRQSQPIPIPGAPPPPPLPPPVSKADQYALEVMAEGRRRGITPRGIQIAFAVVFVESGWKMYANSNVPESLKLPHDAVGSDHDSVGLFQQRHPMWGPLSVLMNPAGSAGLFYDRLVKMDYNNPNRLPGDFAADIQRPAAQYRGRYQERMGDAVALYNRLAGTAPPPPPQPVEGFLMALSDQEQRNLYNAIMNQRRSRSPLRELDENVVGDTPDQIWDMDGSVHVLVVYLMAMLGNPSQLALLNRVATADPLRYPDRQADRQVAQAMLAEVDDNSELKQGILEALGRVSAFREANPALLPIREPGPKVVYLPAPVDPAPVTNGEHGTGLGSVVKTIVDAVEQLKLADALSIEDRATLAASIKILEMKNGAKI